MPSQRQPNGKHTVERSWPRRESLRAGPSAPWCQTRRRQRPPLHPPRVSRLVCLLVVLVFMGTSGLPGMAPAGNGLAATVKIGVLARRGPQKCFERWSATAAYLSEHIPDIPFVIVPLSYPQIGQAVRDEAIDFVLCNPALYVELEKTHGTNRIVSLKNLVNEQSAIEYGGVMFCRSDRKALQSVMDLRGKRFMAADPQSLGGWLAAWRELKALGLNPAEDFQALLFGDIHDAVVYAVRDGAVDAGSVRTDTLERMQAEGVITPDQFRVLKPQNARPKLPFVCSTRTYPEWPLAKVRATPDNLAERVAVALLQMPPESPAARVGHYHGWTIPLNYQPVHECLMDLKVGPYQDLGRITLPDVLQIYGRWLLVAALLFFLMAGATVAIFILAQRLKVSHAKLQAEINERVRAQEGLVKAKNHAEAATRAKSDFLANMSHEIRTPMHGVIAAAELALSEALSPRLEKFLRIIQSSAQSLLGIINDVLDFSKIEADKLAIDARLFELGDVLDSVTDLFLSKAAEKKIELLVDIEPQVPRALIGDPLRLQQVLKNLVDNAVKFTDDTGRVVIGVDGPIEPETEQRAAVKFYVRDTGVGIAPDFIDKLFKPFSQVDASITRRYQGTGLGLSICKQLVDMMGGTIGVDSQLGQGSTFFFTISFRLPSKALRPKPTLPSDLQSLFVLIVDDCRENTEIIAKMLTAFGISCKALHSGRQALDMLLGRPTLEEPIGLVILDSDLGDMNGLEMARKIRRGIMRPLPIIMMTPLGGEAAKQEAQQAGINGLLNKPIYASTLFNAIMDAFGREGLRSARRRKPFLTRASIYMKRLGGARVLVVEDNPTNQLIATELLKQAGIHTQVAGNGREALEALRKELFDAVLMDIQMPEMDGFEATRRMRQNERTRSIPIIAMTAYAMKGDEEKCLAAGMDAYVAKPINQDRLFHILWKVVGPILAKRPPSISPPPPLEAGRPAARRSLPDKLGGIDISSAASALGLDAESFKSVLGEFQRSNQDTMANLRQACTAGRLDRVRQLAHSIKGSAANIGAKPLADIAAKLELVATSRRPSASLLNRFERALEQVLTSLASLEEYVDRDQVPPAVTSAPETLTRLLAELARGLERADPEHVKRCLEKLRAAVDPQQLAALEALIRVYDYDQALAELEAMAEAFYLNRARAKAPRP